MWLGQLGSFGWYVPRWVLVIWVDRMGDEAGVPVGYEGCGWSWGGCGCGRALVPPPSLSSLTPTWFPTNVACNSHVNLLNIEVESLE